MPAIAKLQDIPQDPERRAACPICHGTEFSTFDDNDDAGTYELRREAKGFHAREPNAGSTHAQAWHGAFSIARCNGCHRDGNIALFDLWRDGELRPELAKVSERVKRVKQEENE